MKKFFFIFMLCAFTANVSAETYNVKTVCEQTDRKPKHKKKKHKKSRKAKSHAKKNGLIQRGCGGLSRLPKTHH